MNENASKHLNTSQNLRGTMDIKSWISECKRGQLQNVPSLVMMFIFVGVSLGLGLYVLAEITTEVTAVAGADSLAENATEDATAGLAEFSGWLPIIGLIIAVGIVLYYIFRGFGGARA